MPVDPEIVAMLAASRAAKPVSIDEIPVDEARNGYRLKYDERSFEPSEGIHWEDVDTDSPAERVGLRIYRPANRRTPVPAIIYLHGGGFVLGDTAAYHRQSRRIASLCGAAVIFVEYRLAPEHRFPAAYDDAIAAARYVLEHCDELGFDAERIILMGDSAGANLALGAAIALGGASLRHLCLLYPVVDFRPYVGSSPPAPSDREFGKGFGLDFETMRFFGRHYLGSAASGRDPRASPLLAHRLDMLPSTTIFAAGNDVLRDQGRRFAERLKREGGVVDYVVFDTLIHDFMGHVAVSRQSDLAFQAVCRRVSELLHKGDGALR